MKTVRLYVLAHNDETLSRVPSHPQITKVDLRSLDLESRWQSNQFAETRFLLSADSARLDTDFVGIASPSFSDKWPDEPGLPYLAEHLPRSPVLGPRVGLAPYLSRGNWIEDVDAYHPGMTAILEALVASHSLHVTDRRVPQANTFVCSSELLLGLREFMSSLLSEVLDTYGPDLPFSYRCRFCGSTSEEGVGHYGRDRHIGFLSERLTMLYFAKQRGITFLPTRTVMWQGLAEYGVTELIRATRARMIERRRARVAELAGNS